MRFLHLQMYNFGPYKGEQFLHFPTDQQRRVMVVFGDNMRGKTSLLNAMRWVLYGKALDRLSREMDTTRLVNAEAQRESDWRMWVKLGFESDGVEYELARSVQPLELVSVPQSKRDFQETTLLRRNGSAMRGDRVEAQISHFIPEEVSRFYLFDAELLQEYETLLIEESAQGTKIKEAIEQILGVPALVRGRDELRDLLKKAHSLQAKESKHVAALESQSAQSLRLQEEIASGEMDLLSLKDQLSQITDTIASHDAELQRTQSVRETHRRVEALREDLRRYAEKERDVQRERLDVLKLAWRDLLQPRLAVKRSALSDRIKSFEAGIRKRGAIEERIRVMGTLLESASCPTCGSTMEDARRAEFGVQLGDLNVQLADYQANISTIGTLTQELGALNRITSTSASEVLRRIDRELNHLSIQQTEAEGQMESLSEQLKGHDVARIAQIAREKEGYLRVRGRLDAQIEEVQARMDEKRAKVRQLSVLMTKNPEGRKQKSSREVEVYSSLERVFAESIAVYRERLRNRVAQNATEAFLKLTTESTYSGLTINENYGLAILDRYGSHVSVRSAGAEQIVALSLLSALNKTANRPGPVVIDTPFGRLDPKHRVNIMRFVPEMAEQIVFLVHEGEIERSTGLAPIAEFVGMTYEIQRITSSHSVIAKLKED
jgi:DNA sulfur modification protein DndD